MISIISIFAALAQANRFVAPGHEGVGIGLVPQALTDIGAFMPRRVGASRRIGLHCTCSPIRLSFAQRLDGLPEGCAGTVIGKAPVHLTLFAAGISAAFAAACHGASAGSVAP